MFAVGGCYITFVYLNVIPVIYIDSLGRSQPHTPFLILADADDSLL